MIKMKKLALIGSGVLDSLSPLLFKFFHSIGGEACDYSTLSLDESADDALLKTAIERFDGVNITSPFKYRVARIYKVKGSINTVVNTPQGAVCASTDGEGLIFALRHFGISVKGARLIILGAGGAAYSACQALAREGALINVVSRNADKARELEKELDLISFSKKAEGILSFIPSQKELTLVTKEQVNASAFVFDANYKEESALLKCARDSGVVAIDGLPMLYYQGAKAYKLFFNKELKDAEYRYGEFLYEATGYKRR